MSYVAIIAILGVLVLLHEMGHLLAARALGIPIARFSVGFGPKIWGFRRGPTEYWLSAIPLGGYVLPDLEDPRSYFRIPLGKRILFALAGPIANLLIPIPLFAALNVLTHGATFEGIFVRPFVQTAELCARIVVAIPQVFAQPDLMSGIVGIVSQGGAFVGASVARALQFGIVISLNLAVFNLLPIPILDGGKIVFDVLERLNPKVQRYAGAAAAGGLLFLLALFLFATAIDLRRLA